MNVEHIPAAPARGIRVVLNRLEIPIGVSGHWIDRDAAEEAHLLLTAAAVVDALYERVEIGRIGFGADGDTNQISVGQVLVPVDGVSDLPKAAPKFYFLWPDDLVFGYREGCCRKNDQNEAGNNKFQQSHACLFSAVS